MRATPWRRIGWRNLGRNRRRTLFTLGGLAISYTAVVVMAGLGRGMVAEMVGNGTGLFSGQIQIHAAEYLPERSLYSTIGGRSGLNVAATLAAVEADPSVDAAAPRVYAGGLVSSGEATVAAGFVGVDLALEPKVSTLLESGLRGRHPRSGRNELWIGQEMARQLSVEPDDEIVLVAAAADGSLGNDLFQVAGVFSTGIADVDRSLALVPIDALQTLVALEPDRIHEVAVRLADPWEAPPTAVRLSAGLGPGVLDSEVQPWTELYPEIVQYAELFISVEWLLIAIVFVIAVFGVANTMLMATFERRREFALLRALGATPRTVLRLVFTEAVLLGGVSLICGMMITFPILVWWQHSPPDMSWLYGGFTMAGGLVRPTLRVEYPGAIVFTAAIALFATALLAATFPAIRSSRVAPAETLMGR